MQVAYKENVSTPSVKYDNDHIQHFSLHGTLPTGDTLAFNRQLGTLSYLSYRDGRPCLVLQQQFTDSEMSLLVPLLEEFPHYCPYEVLFASFYNGNVSELVVARARQKLQKAMDNGTWEQEMKPLRNVLSRTRLKLRRFGINISSILETGYILRMVALPEGVEDKMRFIV